MKSWWEVRELAPEDTKRQTLSRGESRIMITTNDEQLLETPAADSISPCQCGCPRRSTLKSNIRAGRREKSGRSVAGSMHTGTHKVKDIVHGLTKQFQTRHLPFPVSGKSDVRWLTTRRIRDCFGSLRCPLPPAHISLFLNR
ncbi:hypothetical protein GWI33_004419 [Rhynchophorus ferrugineus]|uniref:Uncharacterized protein n=1 Tax=Rhynchophorus ferrugineus TaxID=354439 RepID=A0A834MKH4_RHYFE|nr:hypothetical protein GWI33_004419 [Rhynchophorus ferrugineus]